MCISEEVKEQTRKLGILSVSTIRAAQSPLGKTERKKDDDRGEAIT